MLPTIHGFRIHVQVETHHDILIIPALGIETEEQACNIAVLAARHSYPIGAITITQVQAGTWSPTGLWANPEHTALWAS